MRSATLRPLLASRLTQAAAASSARVASRRSLLAPPVVLGARFASSSASAAASGPAAASSSSRGGAIAVGVAALALGLGSTVVYAKDAAKSPVDYQAVRNAVTKIVEDNPDMGPTIVRLAWHTSGTFDKVSKTGGSNGCTIRFPPEVQHGANAGLTTAMAALEPVKKAFPEISYADLFTLAGVVAIEAMGGPKIGWRSGRSDAPNGSFCTPDGRLPDADKGTPKGTIQHVRDIFYRMGFDDREIVALIGAHSLGRCHDNFSGYKGPWTRAPTTFSNEFFRELLENKWTLKRWDGPDQWEDPTGELMMLSADMALLWDKKFRSIVEEYAKDESKFFQDFSKAFQKLEELGVKFDTETKKGWWPF